ncbi:unnamed protein product [Anisakis simplex]|uniref:ATPase ASNA1 homolog n=1 Tax=Anisakis simplex TaxID=6269 RepID=A0A0M3K3G0_ANISI|nr:unnamed protein product [Anisakis simplex]
MEEVLEPSLRNVIEQKSLKWIFVGGKGGVGKTTCSCSLAVQLAKVRRSVLIISTDPAHNISDAFAQKISKTPTIVNGFSNLYAMEIDPKSDSDVVPQLVSASDVTERDMLGVGRQLLQDLVGGLPGIDESMAFAEMIKLIHSMDFDVVVFDTAPTGHTLRLLHFPDILEHCLSKILTLQNSFSPLISQAGGMLGLSQNSAEETVTKVRETLDLVKKINAQFKNEELTTFVCVCIAEFLSLYETERLIQELTKQKIDTHNVVVNQLVYPDKDETGCVKCKKCNARYKIQKKYLEQALEMKIIWIQIEDLYEDFNVTKLPLMDNEVRGRDHICRFSEYLIDPFDQSKHSSGFDSN